MLRTVVMQDAQAQQGFALEQVSRAATDLGEATMAMPGWSTFTTCSQIYLSNTAARGSCYMRLSKGGVTF